MTYTLELIPRGTHEVVSQELQHAVDPARWTETEAAAIVKGMLRALARLNPQSADAEPSIALRGISWIVSTHNGGTVIALEIPSGQAVAGPFAIDRERLHGLVASAVSHDAPATTVH